MLKYVGGGAFFQGVPTRDLTDDDVAEVDQAALVASGLYAEVSFDVSAETDSTSPLVPLPEEKGDIDLSDGVNDTEAALAGKALRARKK